MKDGKSKRGLWAEGLEHKEPLWQESLAPLRGEGHQQESNHILSRNFKLVSELGPGPGSVPASCTSQGWPLASPTHGPRELSSEHLLGLELSRRHFLWPRHLAPHPRPIRRWWIHTLKRPREPNGERWSLTGSRSFSARSTLGVHCMPGACASKLLSWRRDSCPGEASVRRFLPLHLSVGSSVQERA